MVTAPPAGDPFVRTLAEMGRTELGLLRDEIPKPPLTLLTPLYDLCSMLLHLPEAERPLFARLLPLSIVRKLLNPGEFLAYQGPIPNMLRDEANFCAGMLPVLKEWILSYWKAVPRKKRRQPIVHEINTTFGDNVAKVVLAVWPALPTLVACDDLRVNIDVRNEQQHQTLLRSESELLNNLHLVLLLTGPIDAGTSNFPKGTGRPIAQNTERFCKHVSRVVARLAHGRGCEPADVAQGVIEELSKRGPNQLISLAYRSELSTLKYWSVLITNIATDWMNQTNRVAGMPAPSTRRKYLLADVPWNDHENEQKRREGLRSHYDPTENTVTVAQLAKAIRRPASTVSKALRVVELATRRSAPAEGRFKRLDRWWVAEIKKVLDMMPKRKRRPR